METESNNCGFNHILGVDAVCARYGKLEVLHDLNFSIACGKRMAIIGPNGAGKSTLLRILAGLKKQSAGDVYWREKALSHWSHEIAYLPQIDSHQKDFPITVKEVVAMGRYPKVSFWKSYSKSDMDKVDEAMKVMEIEDLADRQIDALSGGQQQRAYIARCLAQEAHVILLDEPFNGLDTESQTHLAVTLKMLSERGHLIIASHHNLDTVTKLFDEVLVVNKQQVAFGKSEEVMALPEVCSLFHCAHY